MTEVWMVYTGIISFWQNPEDGDVWLFAPDARSAAHSHLGWVLAPRSQVDNASKTCQEIDLGKTHADEVRAFKVFNWIEPQFEGEGGLTLSPGFEESLVTLADLNPRFPPKLNRRVIAEVPDPFTLFKSRLRYGSLSAVAFDTSCYWRFEHQPDADAKVLAQAVVHRFTIDSDSLVVDFGDRCSLNMKAQHIAPIGKTIFVLVGNTMRGDILPTATSPTDKDEHVRLYHQLAAQSHRSGARSLVCAKAGPDKPPQSLKIEGSVPWWVTLAVDGANCPPGWWEEVEGG